MKFGYLILRSAANALIGVFFGRNARPTFFDITNAYPVRDDVTRAYPIAQKEIDCLLAEWDDLPRYHEVAPGKRNIVRTLEAFTSARSVPRRAAA